MTALLAIASATLLVLLAPYLAGRLFDRRAPSRTVAALHLFVLIGAATLPLAVIACLLLIRPDHHGWRPTAVVHATKWAAAAFGALYVLRLWWVATLAVGATRRVSAAAVLAAQERVPMDEGEMLIIPAARPIAYTIGGSKRLVVSRGLFSLLDERERTAAIAHEIAHIRLRHHRLILLGQVLSSAFGFALPPMRRAFASLRRELEAIADDEAACRVQDKFVVANALAKVAAADPLPAPAPALGNFEDLAYRIERLVEPVVNQDRRVMAAVGVALVALGMVLAYCAAFHPALWAAGLGLCALALALFAHNALARPGRA